MASPSAPLQSAPKVSIYLRDGDKFYRAVEAANRKLRPHVALVEGKEQRLPQAVYTLRYQVDGKRKWEVVGPDPQVAVEQKIRRERTLAAQAAGVMPVDETPEDAPVTSLLTKVREYLKETKDHKARRTYLAYRLSLGSFSKSCDAPLEKVSRDHIMTWIGAMKGGGPGPSHHL